MDKIAERAYKPKERVYEDDLLEYVYVPVPDRDLQIQIAERQKNIYSDYWRVAQEFLKGFVETHNQLLSSFEKEDMNGV